MSTQDCAGRRRTGQGIAVAGVSLVALVLSLVFLGDRSLWLDEGYSVHRRRAAHGRVWLVFGYGYGNRWSTSTGLPRAWEVSFDHSGGPSFSEDTRVLLYD